MTIISRLSILLIFIAGYNSAEINHEPKIQDLTLYRDSFAEYQKEYNERALKDYKALLAKPRLQPLTDLPIDSNCFRLTIQSSWGSVWSGSSLSLAIYSNNKKCQIETSEIIRWKEHFLNQIENPYLSKNLYTADTAAFNQLSKEISKSDFWNRYSFNENDGWMNTDPSFYFLEAKIDSSYKIIMEEVSDLVNFYYLHHFSNATGYNDTTKDLLERDLERRYKK